MNTAFILSQWGFVAKYVVVIFLDAAIVYLEAHSMWLSRISSRMIMTNWWSLTLYNILLWQNMARILGDIILLSVFPWLRLKSTLAIRAWFHIFNCILIIAKTSHIFNCLCFGTTRWGFSQWRRLLLTKSLLLITPSIITFQISRWHFIRPFSNLLLRRITVPRWLLNVPRRISPIAYHHLTRLLMSIGSIYGGLS